MLPSLALQDSCHVVASVAPTDRNGWTHSTKVILDR